MAATLQSARGLWMETVASVGLSACVATLERVNGRETDSQREREREEDKERGCRGDHVRSVLEVHLECAGI